MKKIIEDIINLKEKYNLVESDATVDRQKEWYDFAIRNGLVVTEYMSDKLIGFAEFVRLKSIPKHPDRFQEHVSDFTTGPVVLIGNLIANCPKTMWSLRKKLYKANRNFSYVCFHRKKTGKIKAYKNMRRNYALS